jgi:hypothetical protein
LDGDVVHGAKLTKLTRRSGDIATIATAPAR